MKEYDVVIIGGGIHGAGVLQAAVAAGHSALLIERQALAAGTSSRSSKLIHGGLRYLESGQFALVRESLRERAIHLRIASELVALKPFYIPVYRDTRRRPWQLKIGLWIYALLGGFDAATRFGSVPKSEWPQLDGLKTQDLDAVIRYHDAQTNDALLTRAVVKSALRLGAELAMPAQYSRAMLSEDGVTVTYTTAGAAVECRARVLINAAGPWAMQAARAVEPAIPIPDVDLVQGTHIVIPHPLTRRHLLRREPHRRTRGVRHALGGRDPDRHHRNTVSRRPRQRASTACRGGISAGGGPALFSRLEQLDPRGYHRALRGPAGPARGDAGGF